MCDALMQIILRGHANWLTDGMVSCMIEFRHADLLGNSKENRWKQEHSKCAVSRMKTAKR